MTVRELLKEFTGDNEVYIYDNDCISPQKYDRRDKAIVNYGHYSVIRWSVVYDTINIAV